MSKLYPFLKARPGETHRSGKYPNQNNSGNFKVILYVLCFVACVILSLISFCAGAGTYYSNNAATSSVNNWWTGMAGTGTHPSNFTTSGDVFILQTGQTCVTAGSWTIGAGVILQIDGTLSITNNNSYSLCQILSYREMFYTIA